MFDPDNLKDSDNPEHWFWIVVIGGCSLIAWIAFEIYQHGG